MAASMNIVSSQYEIIPPAALTWINFNSCFLSGKHFLLDAVPR